VVTNGGYPLDQNLYQAVKGMYTASKTTRDGGVIICLAECRDGVGGENFLPLGSSAPSPQDLLARIERTPAGATAMDQWEVQSLVQVLCRQKVILVSENISSQTAEAMHLMHASDLGEALRKAEDLVGMNGSITVIPDGVQVVIHSASNHAQKP
jgi:nickel-dependent lactate racemase